MKVKSVNSDQPFQGTYHILGRQLGQVARMLANRINYAFRQAGYDLTHEQWSVLTDLAKEDGLSQQQFADRNGKNKASITSLINNLEKKGLVTRKTDKYDRRSNRIHLTNEGRKQHEALIPVYESVIQELMQPIPNNEMTTGMEMLRMLLGGLQDKSDETANRDLRSTE